MLTPVLVVETRSGQQNMSASAGNANSSQPSKRQKTSVSNSHTTTSQLQRQREDSPVDEPSHGDCTESEDGYQCPFSQPRDGVAQGQLCVTFGAHGRKTKAAVCSFPS